MTELAKGRAYRNPEYFLLADPRAKDVIVVGDYPNIINTYEAMGAIVRYVRRDDWDALNCRTLPRTAPHFEEEELSQTPVIPLQEPVERRPSRSAGSPPIPADWQQMPWADLRRLAASVSGTAIINKLQAFDAIEAALAFHKDGEVDG